MLVVVCPIQHKAIEQIYNKDLMFLFLPVSCLPKMTATFVAIWKIACAVGKLESYYAKLALAKVFVRFA
jgi:hypothetical protein